MNIHPHSQFVAGRSSFILFLLVQIVTAPAFATQNQMQLASSQVSRSPQIAVAKSFFLKTAAIQTDSNAKRRLYVTVINMSGKPRQAALGKSKVDLPVGQHVVLQMRPGDTLRVISNANSKLEERFVISEQDAARVLTVQ